VSKARPSISYVVNTLNPGGTERLVVEMSRAFAADFDIEVVCLDEAGTWAELLTRDGLPVHTLNRRPGIDTSMPSKLARRFREHGTRIIHAHQTTPWFYSALSRLIHPAPRLLFEEHGRFYPEVDHPLKAWFNRIVTRSLTHRFVAVSDDIRGRLAKYEGVRRADVEVIYNGVEPPVPLTGDERRALRQELGFLPDDFVVGTIGRFDPIKNLPMLVAGLEAAACKVPAIAGLLVGDGPVFADIRALVDRGPLRDRIRLTGYRSDAGRLTQCLDLFVLASFSEGTSMALLEAMATGVPAVVTAVGGNPEIVLEGETGWTVPSGATEALATAIGDAASDADKRGRLAAAARRRFEQHFTMQGMIANYRQRYHELLSL
jgi:glycosyltransferase involved in cell wall biosynthesis